MGSNASVILELNRRRNDLSPEQQKILDELIRRQNPTGQAQQPPGFQSPTGYKRKPLDLPQPSNDDILQTAASALPYIGGTAAALAVPGGPLAAIAAAGGGAGIGSLIEQGIQKMAGLPEAPQSLGDVASRTGQDALLKGALPEAGGRVLSGALEKALSKILNPTRLYQSALRPTGNPVTAQEAVQTGIREGIVPREGAADIARGRINNLNAGIEAAISQTPGDIPPAQYVARVQDKLDALRKRWGADASYGKQFVRQIDDFERRFLLQHGNPTPIETMVASHTNPNIMTPQTVMPEDMTLQQLRHQANPIEAGRAQEIKKATYRTIRTRDEGAWDPGSHPGLSTEVSQDLAAAMKEELENLYPQTQGMNKREGSLIGLEQQLQNWQKREGNKTLLPYFVFPAAGAVLGGTHGAEGAGIGASAGMIAGHMLRSALEDPAVKARLAIVLSRAAQMPGAQTIGKIASTVGPELPATAVRATEFGTEQH